jgi:hypothetical protein
MTCSWRNLGQRGRELVGTRASVNINNSKLQRLEKMCEERRGADESLLEKWKMIEEFDARRIESVLYSPAACKHGKLINCSS